MDITAVLFDPIHLDIFGAQGLPFRDPQGIRGKSLRVRVGCPCRQAQESRRQDLVQLVVFIHLIGGNLQKILVFAEHVVLHGFLIAVKDRRQGQAEQEQQVCKKDPDEEDHIASRILKKDPHPESGGEGNVR